jgi:hypothetical protein
MTVTQKFPCWPALDDCFTAAKLNSALARPGQEATFSAAPASSRLPVRRRLLNGRPIGARPFHLRKIRVNQGDAAETTALDSVDCFCHACCALRTSFAVKGLK